MALEGDEDEEKYVMAVSVSRPSRPHPIVIAQPLALTTAPATRSCSLLVPKPRELQILRRAVFHLAQLVDRLRRRRRRRETPWPPVRHLQRAECDHLPTKAEAFEER